MSSTSDNNSEENLEVNSIKNNEDDDNDINDDEKVMRSKLATDENCLIAYNNQESCGNRTLSWHEHVYRKLTNKPTPHYIENILGIQNNKSGQFIDTEDTMKTNILSVSEHVTQHDNFSKIPPSVTEINEPLNLSVKSELKIRTKTVKGLLIHLITLLLFITYFVISQFRNSHYARA